MLSGTELLLEHDGLSEASRAGHGEAWVSCLEKLEAELGDQLLQVRAVVAVEVGVGLDQFPERVRHS